MGKTFGPEEFENLRKSKLRQGFDQIYIDVPMDKDLLQRMELSGFKNQKKEKFS
jgi:16S rRNA G966 N2-methylase RsmD